MPPSREPSCAKARQLNRSTRVELLLVPSKGNAARVHALWLEVVLLDVQGKLLRNVNVFHLTCFPVFRLHDQS